MTFEKSISTTIAISDKVNLYSYVLDLDSYNNVIIASVNKTNEKSRCSTLDVNNFGTSGKNIIILDCPAQKDKVEFKLDTYVADKWNYSQNFKNFRIYWYEDYGNLSGETKVYVYSGSTKNHDWPGVTMTWIRDGNDNVNNDRLFYYDIDLTKFSYSDTVIIFHDNNENKQTVNIKLKDGKNDFYYPTGWTDDGKLNAGCIYSGSQTKTPITK